MVKILFSDRTEHIQDAEAEITLNRILS